MGAHEKILPMTPEEIKREYLEAKDGAQQIRILADENLCSVSKIKTVLEAQGVELPKKRAYTKKPPKERFTLAVPSFSPEMPAPKPEKPKKAYTAKPPALYFSDKELELLVDLLGIAQDASIEAIEKHEAELEAAKENFNIAKGLQTRFKQQLPEKEKNE